MVYFDLCLGVTIPSQIRYTGYIEAFLSETKGGNLEFREVENSGGIREAEKDNMIVTSAVYRSKARSGIRDENKESLLELVWVPQDMDLSPRSSPAQLLHFKQNSPTLYFTHMRVNLHTPLSLFVSLSVSLPHT